MKWRWACQTSPYKGRKAKSGGERLGRTITQTQETICKALLIGLPKCAGAKRRNVDKQFCSKGSVMRSGKRCRQDLQRSKSLRIKWSFRMRLVSPRGLIPVSGLGPGPIPHHHHYMHSTSMQYHCGENFWWEIGEDYWAWHSHAMERSGRAGS